MTIIDLPVINVPGGKKLKISPYIVGQTIGLPCRADIGERGVGTVAYSWGRWVGRLAHIHITISLASNLLKCTWL